MCATSYRRLCKFIRRGQLCFAGRSRFIKILELALAARGVIQPFNNRKEEKLNKLYLGMNFLECLFSE